MLEKNDPRNHHQVAQRVGSIVMEEMARLLGQITSEVLFGWHMQVSLTRMDSGCSSDELFLKPEGLNWLKCFMD